MGSKKSIWLLSIVCLVFFITALSINFGPWRCQATAIRFWGRDIPTQKLTIAVPKAITDIEYDRQFVQKWKCDTGQTVDIERFSAPSGELKVDIVQGKIHPDAVILSNPAEIDAIVEKTGIVSSNWRHEFPYNSSPYYSSVLFVVRSGNPKGIKDWPDLVLPNRSIAVSNPKTCGGGRWVYTAALGFASRQFNNDEPKIKEFMSNFYRNVAVVYPNQGEAGEAFFAGKGDVLVTYGSFGLSAKNKGKEIELIIPSSTIEIAISVAIASKNTEKNNTTELARAYLNGLYDIKTQKLLGRNFWQPRLSEAIIQTAEHFPKVNMFQREDVFKAGEDVEKKHLEDEGVYDSLH